MSEKNGTCFDASHLSRFLHEQLNEADESSVLIHLNDCRNCQIALESVAADGSMWTDLHEYFSERHDRSSIPDQTPSEDVVSHLVDLLGPTDYPDMMGRLGSYEICGVVGRGSTGVVAKAFEPRLNRYVAIKVLSPNFASSGSARSRFEREARAVAAVAHEHVVPVFSVNEYRNVPYLVMQYVGGGSLQQRIDREGPLDVCEVVRIGMQVASGLAAAHAQGIVHRDVKPANVMLESGVERAMVTDFGLARVIDEASMTRSGIITGTPQFMSPEQAKGEYIDHRSDLFSLGSLMYTASTGRPPFRSETVYGVIRRVCESDMRPVREVNPAVPEWLDAFIARLCEKDREKRFETAVEAQGILAQELSHLQSPTPTSIPDRSWDIRAKLAKRPTSSGKKLVWFSCLTVATLTFLFALSRPWEKKRDRTEQNVPMVASDVSAETPKDVSEPQFDFANFVWNAENQPVFESRITRAIPVDSGGRLKLLAGRGNVEILPSESQQLEVRAVRRVAAANQLEASALLAKHHLDFRMDENGMIVEAQVANSVTTKFDNVEYQVFVPDRYSVDITTLGGDVSAGTIGGELIARTHGGSVDANEIIGPVRLITDGGIVSIHSIHGSATIESIEGHLHLGHVRGDVSATTTIGDIVLDEIEGSAEIQTSSGSVEVSFADQPENASWVRTIGGNISISLRPDLAVDLNAESVGGFVRVPFVKSMQSTKKLATPFNGGGVPINANSVSGRITFRSSDSTEMKSQPSKQPKEYKGKW